ncbi:MAG: hypothetical protein AAGA45_03575, partial [Verrucomicrobiota bacterium]
PKPKEEPQPTPPMPLSVLAQEPIEDKPVLKTASAKQRARPVHRSKLKPAKGGKDTDNQEEFLFVSEEEQRGFFEKTERNVFEGEDLDVPTFLRRGVRIAV